MSSSEVKSLAVKYLEYLANWKKTETEKVLIRLRDKAQNKWYRKLFNLKMPSDEKLIIAEGLFSEMTIIEISGYESKNIAHDLIQMAEKAPTMWVSSHDLSMIA